jgi:hypothetical protein
MQFNRKFLDSDEWTACAIGYFMCINEMICARDHHSLLREYCGMTAAREQLKDTLRRYDMEPDQDAIVYAILLSAGEIGSNNTAESIQESIDRASQMEAKIKERFGSILEITQYLSHQSSCYQ